METLKKFLQKIDSIAPDPWYINGVKQSKPSTQLVFLIGVTVGLILSYFLF